MWDRVWCEDLCLADWKMARARGALAQAIGNALFGWMGEP